MTRPNSLPLLPPLGCAILFFFCFFVFFVSWFLGFLVFWFLVFWFVVGFSAMAKQNQNAKKKQKMTRPNSLPLLPPLGCAILFFCVVCFFGFVFFFVFFWFFVFLGFLVSWLFGFLLLVRCWFFEGLRT